MAGCGKSPARVWWLFPYRCQPRTAAPSSNSTGCSGKLRPGYRVIPLPSVRLQPGRSSRPSRPWPNSTCDSPGMSIKGSVPVFDAGSTSSKSCPNAVSTSWKLLSSGHPPQNSPRWPGAGLYWPGRSSPGSYHRFATRLDWRSRFSRACGMLARSTFSSKPAGLPDWSTSGPWESRRSPRTWLDSLVNGSPMTRHCSLLALAAYQKVRPLEESESALFSMLEAAGDLLIAGHWLRWHFLERRSFDDPTEVSRGVARGLHDWNGWRNGSGASRGWAGREFDRSRLNRAAAPSNGLDGSRRPARSRAAVLPRD